MAMQKIENGFKIGLERVGFVTPSRLAPRVLEVLRSYQDEGFGMVTTPQIRERLEELYPSRGWLPIATGNLPGAISLLERRRKIDTRIITRKDEAGTYDVLAYSLVEKPQNLQTTGS